MLCFSNLNKAFLNRSQVYHSPMDPNFAPSVETFRLLVLCSKQKKIKFEKVKLENF